MSECRREERCRAKAGPTSPLWNLGATTMEAYCPFGNDSAPQAHMISTLSGWTWMRPHQPVANLINTLTNLVKPAQKPLKDKRDESL